MLCSFVLSSFFSYSAHAERKVIDQVVAVIDRDLVLQSEIEEFKKEQILAGLPSDQQTLVQLVIENKLIRSVLAAKKMLISDEELKEEIKKNWESLGIPSEEEFRNALKSENQTYEAYEKRMRTQFEMGRFGQLVQQKMKLNSEDLEFAIKEKSKNQPKRYTYELAMILTKDEKKIEACKKRINEGEAFSKVVDTCTEGPGVGSGGIIGKFKADELDEKIAEVILHLVDHEVSVPIETSNGFEIFQIVSKEELPPMSADELRKTVEDELLRKQFNSTYSAYIAELKSEKWIQVF